MANELADNTDPDDLGPDPDTVRAAMRERDSTTEREKPPEQRIMDDPDMGEDEHPDDGRGDRDAAPSKDPADRAPKAP